MIEYKGYTGVFEFDPELSLFSGHVVDLRDEIYFEGESVEELKGSLQRAVDHYLSVCEARGEEPERPFSGKLHLRLGSDVHRAAAVTAAAEGESLNAWLVKVVESAAATRPSVVRERATPQRRDQTAAKRRTQRRAKPRGTTPKKK